MASESDEAERRSGVLGSTLQRGDRIGNYIVQRKLGSGGQAEVLLAKDVVLQRPIALKVFRPGGGLSNLRGLDEARVVATLMHPNIVQIFHVELCADTWYLAMELMDGGNLQERVHRLGPLPLRTALRYAADMAEVLRHAHQVGVIHRDLKPQNVLLSRAGVLKVADFGLAAVLGRDGPASARVGVGTPQFRPPELWLGEPATVRSDLYGLGGTLFCMLTGAPPFAGTTEEALRQAHLQEVVRVPDRFPAEVADLVRALMAKRMADRPETADMALEEIQRVLTSVSSDRRRASRRPPSASNPARQALARRHAADAALLELQPFSEANGRLSDLIATAPPLLIVHGPRADVVSRLVRSVLDANADRYYVVARVTLSDARESLIRRLVQQLHLAPASLLTSHERIVRELAPAAWDLRASSGRATALPGVLEIDVRRALLPSEASDLVKLARLCSGKLVTLLLMCSDEPARSVIAELEAGGALALLGSQRVRAPSLEESMLHAQIWTRCATGARLHWTDDALLLVAWLASANKAPFDRLVHNATTIADLLGARFVDTFCVLGAASTQDVVRTIDDVPERWRTRPGVWPSPKVLATLQRIRRARAAADP